MNGAGNDHVSVTRNSSDSVFLPRLLSLRGGGLGSLPFEDSVWYFLYVRNGLAGGDELDYLAECGRVRGR